MQGGVGPGTNTSPIEALWKENILDDVNNAHTRIDEHMEQSDAWLRDFDARMATHGKLAMEMYHTVIELKQIVNEQQRQIKELQAVVRPPIRAL